MADYRAPIEDIRFALNEIAGLAGLAELPGYEAAEPEVVDHILEEAAKLANEKLAPLNWSGDREGVRFENGVMRLPEGFAEAYSAYVEAGWNALPFDSEHGGHGLPWTVALALIEMWNSANMSWALCPLLTIGAVESLQEHGTDWQKRVFLPKLISGEWTGTMNLTEPQAGSDVGALKTRAVPDSEHYRITGQKIYITWGEHAMTENIAHLVLARLPDAPDGTKGISLFLVPKYIPREDGTPGEPNDLRCVSIEHKMGIHGSPTCTMAYGDNGGAIGYLIGEENKGMACMFTMMNNARLNVGVQGLAIAERAYQDARAYAFDRVQSRPVDGSDPTPVAIVKHPDVRRMLTTMKAEIAAMRALVFRAGGALDRAKRHPDAQARQAAQGEVDLLTPVVKAWCTDLAVEITSTAIQVHGGMGYVEQTGVAQHYRDARIAPIYEGTNGIQAMDLLGRKLLRDNGGTAKAFIADMRALLEGVDQLPDGHGPVLREAVSNALDTLESATETVIALAGQDIARAAAVATPYLHLFGTVTGGALLARSAIAVERRMAESDADSERERAQALLARFYADAILPKAQSLAASVAQASESTLALSETQF